MSMEVNNYMYCIYYNYSTGCFISVVRQEKKQLYDWEAALVPLLMSMKFSHAAGCLCVGFVENLYIS